MAHVAKQVLDAIVAAVTGLTTTGAHVFVDRAADRQLKDTHLPALLVTMGGEDVAIESVSPAAQAHRVQRVTIGIRVKHTSGRVDDTLNQIRAEVEIALAAAVIGSGHVILNYNGMDDPSFDEESERPIVSADLNYTAEYYTDSANPTVFL